LASLDGRLTPSSARRIIKAIVIPTLLYGAEFLKPLQIMKRKMKIFRNKTMRWIMNCFYMTNMEVLSIKACLLPIKLLLKQIRKMAAICVTRRMADFNKVTAILPGGLPINQKYRFQTNRSVAVQRKEKLKPKTWNSTLTTSVKRTVHIEEVSRLVDGIFEV
jgi:hypothetical protein